MVAGLLALQLVAAVPVIGLLAVLAATQAGAGAMGYRVWRERHIGVAPA